MGLTLVVGPAHAGKVSSLLDTFVAQREREPWLVVPNRAEVERIERDLIARGGGLLGGNITTFDGLFEHLARGADQGRPIVRGAARALLFRRAVERPGAQATTRQGVVDALGGAVAELAGSLVDADRAGEQLAEVARGYHRSLDEIGCWDIDMMRRVAVERLTERIDAWDGHPVLAYGFEDLTGVEWRLVEALAARGDVWVSLPFEPGRVAYASLSRTAGDLAALAGEVVRLPPASEVHLPRSLAHIERHLFSDGAPVEPIDGALRFLEGGGRRATLELVAAEVLELVAQGVPPEEIAIVVPTLDARRAAIESALPSLGVPVAVEGPDRLGRTPLGRALLDLLAFAWGGADRRPLFAFLRSPFSSMPRSEVDFLEGRLRGRGVITSDRVVELVAELRGGRALPLVDELRAAVDPSAAVLAAATRLVANAHDLYRPGQSHDTARDLRAFAAITDTCGELQRLVETGVPIERDDVVGALERCTVGGARTGTPGSVVLLDLLRIRTRRFDSVFVLGLEQGGLPRRAPSSPFLDDDLRRDLDARFGARLARPDQASRDRYLFLTACTRPTRRLFLVREASSDEGSPRQPGPFWEAAQSLFEADDVRRATVRRPLSRVTWPLEHAPTERERLRALARLASHDPDGASALAASNGWERRLGRAQRAWSRGVRLRDPGVLRRLAARDGFRVTDLERMAGCSAAWFVERLLSPGEIDRTVDAKVRGLVAHTALQRFYAQLPSVIPGAERVTRDNLDAAVALMRECVDSAVASGVRFDITDTERRELLHSLRRDLEQFVRGEADAASRFVPRRLEVGFAYEVADGLAVRGKIDRVDVDPHSARGVVIDYKSGRAPTARQIEAEDRIQVPLYMLVLREQLGLEPVGGLYVPLGGGRRARGMMLAGDEPVPGYAREDYLEPEQFDAAIDGARSTAVALAERIRTGDIRHDPQGGECPTWCDLWRVCRKERP